MRRILLPTLAVAVLVFVAGCGSSSGATQPSITVYSGQHPQTVAALVAAFEKQTGIKVKVRSDDEDVLARRSSRRAALAGRRLLSPRTRRRSRISQQRGLLARVDASTLAKTSAKYSSPQKRWVGVSARVSVMVYNTDELQPAQLPKSVLDLADPKWKGKLALAPSETDFQPIVTAVAARYGNGAHGQVARRARRRTRASHTYPDNETLVAEVNTGQRRARRHQPLLLVPPARRARRARRSTPPSTSSPPATPAT